MASGPGISISGGFVLATSDGQLVVVYEVTKWGTTHHHVDTTTDLARATVSPTSIAVRQAEALLGRCRRLPVVVERVVRLAPDDFKLENTPADPKQAFCEQCGSGSCNGECL